MTAGIRFVVGAMLAVLFSALFSVDVHAQPAATRVAVLGADTATRREDVRARLAAQGLDVTAIDVAWQQPFPPRRATSSSRIRLSSRGRLRWGPAMPIPSGWATRWPPTWMLVAVSCKPRTASPWERLSASMARGEPEVTRPLRSRVATNVRSPNIYSLVAVQPAHPILSGVAAVSISANAMQHNPALQGCGTELIANWSNGPALAAARVGPRGGRIVGLNMYPRGASSGPGRLDRRWRSHDGQCHPLCHDARAGATGRCACRSDLGSDRHDVNGRRALQASGHPALFANRCVRCVRWNPESGDAQSIRRGVDLLGALSMPIRRRLGTYLPTTSTDITASLKRWGTSILLPISTAAGAVTDIVRSLKGRLLHSPTPRLFGIGPLGSPNPAGSRERSRRPGELSLAPVALSSASTLVANWNDG